jgi:ABC-type branched-subunit amino acid transport system permease subunit
MSLAWSFYISTVLVYLGVDVMACWGLNLQYGYTGILNFSFIIYQSAGAYTAAVLTLWPDTAGSSSNTSAARTCRSRSRLSPAGSRAACCRRSSA